MLESEGSEGLYQGSLGAAYGIGCSVDCMDRRLGRWSMMGDASHECFKITGHSEMVIDSGFFRVANLVNAHFFCTIQYDCIYICMVEPLKDYPVHS